jgi:two-component system phosphate regulon sensor histidine kinase PhoR
MKTKEQIRTDVVNYLNKTSKHLFVDDKGNLFKVIFDEKSGRYITIQGDRVSASYNTIDESIEYYGSNAKCVIKKGCEAPILLKADKEKTRQVLINLVDNAIKYGKQNGYIEASVYNTDGKNILVEISDDGIGISEEHLPRIFERFYRTDYGRSRNIGGTGLGLAICKHIIEAHGHSIHVRSKLDIGTTFGFTLNKA